MIVKRLDPISFAKITGILYAIFGAVAGCIFALVSLVGGAASDRPGGPVFGAVFGFGAIVFLPVLYGGMGFIMTLLMAALYNWVASWAGGVEIEVEPPSPGSASSPNVV
jgi:hypothetical protein